MRKETAKCDITLRNEILVQDLIDLYTNVFLIDATARIVWDVFVTFNDNKLVGLTSLVYNCNGYVQFC